MTSGQNAEYIAHRPSNRSLPIPAFPRRTPARPTVQSSPYRSPIMPSPFKHHVVTLDSVDDVFSSPARVFPIHEDTQTRRISFNYESDDEDEDLGVDERFRVDDSGFAEETPLFNSRSAFPPPSSSPYVFMRTPVKATSPRSAQTLGRPALSLRPTNSPMTTVGTKRKPAPTPTSLSTPDRRLALTPLRTTGSGKFDILAPPPLAAPRFGTNTPHSNDETERDLKSGEDSLTRLRIREHDMRTMIPHDEAGMSLFADLANARNVKAKNKRLTGLSVAIGDKGKGLAKADEVVEDMSPGGHINKRRARSRPVSKELQMLSTTNTPAIKGSSASNTLSTSKSMGSIPFPSSTRRLRKQSASSVSSVEASSPRARSRRTSGVTTRSQTQAAAAAATAAAPQRAPLARNTARNVSQATLFFGPVIPQTEPRTKKQSMNDMNIDIDLDAPTPERKSSWVTSGGNSSPDVRMSSWQNSPTAPRTAEDEKIDAFFSSPPEKEKERIAICISACTPSPTKSTFVEKLPKKFRARDSGIALDADSSDEDGMDLGNGTGGVRRPGLVLQASGSLSSIYSESGDEALVTPVFGPGLNSGWPRVGVVGVEDSAAMELSGGLSGLNEADGVEAFVLRTLTAQHTKPTSAAGEAQRPPGTPVKKVKTHHLVGRPWQSAVAHKIGLPEFDPPADDEQVAAGNGKGKPRKSLPAALFVPATTREATRTRKDALSFGGLEGEGEDDEVSPSTRKQIKYTKPASVRPPVPLFPIKDGAVAKRASWITRRTSSGTFSSGGSDMTISQNATPTRADVLELPTEKPATVGAAAESSPKIFEWTSSQSSTTSSASTVTNSPSVAAAARHGRAPATNGPTHRRGRSQSNLFEFPIPKDSSPKKSSLLAPRRPSRPRSAVRGRVSLIISEEERPGRFERDFVEVDELGQGEFGRVMKARYKEHSKEVFAVKKCKRFEGFKHRLRLREEVDALKHLANVASEAGFGRSYPNVLGYVDSWEEDETLYIQTELCALGNFGHFLWEYGREYPKLDEARVWKIFAELSSGLRFIHDAGIIHLDLKPANIFITAEGRFKIGDFGLASVWPRPKTRDPTTGQLSDASFEREGDKFYLAPEVLQGKYGPAVDIFSLGVTMLETATNIIVPDQGDAWHRLRHDRFEQVDFSDCSTELVSLLKSMMRSDPKQRIDATEVYSNPVIMQARVAMQVARDELGLVLKASALAHEPEGWLNDVLARAFVWDPEEMDTSP